MRVNGKAVTGWVTVDTTVEATGDVTVETTVGATLAISSIQYPNSGNICKQSLLLFLRNDLSLNGPKYGCGLGQCGACTVLVDGRAARACVIPADGLPGRDVTTLEGLMQSGGREGVGADRPPVLHPVQQAFADTQAAQCGYCLNGMVMMTVALLAQTPHPSDTQIRQHLSHNLCRCGTHIEILRAVHRAAELMADRVAELMADKISGHSAI